MSDMGFTPNLQASASVLPFRFVTLTPASGAFTGGPADAITKQVIGVSDGSVYQFDKTEHAISGLPITLQPSNTVQVMVGTGGVSVGDYLMPQASGDGKAVTATGATAVSNYIALEAGAANEIIRAYRFGQRGPIF